MNLPGTEELEGAVHRYSVVREYGFITVHGDPREFRFTKNEIPASSSDYPDLKPGQQVRFRAVRHEGKWRAEDLKLTDSSSALTKDRSESPFDVPGHQIDPSRFGGRRKYLRVACEELARGSILLHGPSGIGTSSLAYQLVQLIQNPGYLFDTTQFTKAIQGLTEQYHHVVYTTYCGEEMASEGPIDHLVRKVSADSLDGPIKVPARTSIERLARVIEDRIQVSPPAAQNQRTRLLVWIDQVTDQLPKLVSILADLTREGVDHRKVVFVLSGTESVEGGRARIKRILVEPMSREEVAEVLQAAAERTKSQFTPDAEERLYELSEGSPAALYELADYAFQANKDWLIDRSDVGAGYYEYLRSKGRLQELRNRLQARKTEVERAVLCAIVTAQRSGADLSHMIRQFPTFRDQIPACIEALLRRGVIENSSTGKEPFYTIKDKEFGEYLFAIFDRRQ